MDVSYDDSCNQTSFQLYREGYTCGTSGKIICATGYENSGVSME